MAPVMTMGLWLRRVMSSRKAVSLMRTNQFGPANPRRTHLQSVSAVADNDALDIVLVQMLLHFGAKAQNSGRVHFY
jgi:hypothetical protein